MVVAHKEILLLWKSKEGKSGKIMIKLCFLHICTPFSGSG